MNCRKIAMLFFTLAIFLSLAVGVVHAGTATDATVFASSTPNFQGIADQFNVGQTIYIGWIAAPTDATVDISVTDPNNNQVTLTLPSGVSTPTNLPQDDSLQVSFPATTTGTYTITVSGATYQIAVSTVLVLPQSPAGTLMPILTGAAAVGVLAVLKVKRPRVQ